MASSINMHTSKGFFRSVMALVLACRVDCWVRTVWFLPHTLFRPSIKPVRATLGIAMLGLHTTLEMKVVCSMNYTHPDVHPAHRPGGGREQVLGHRGIIEDAPVSETVNGTT